MKKGHLFLFIIFILLTVGFFTNLSDVNAFEYTELPDSDYQFLDYSDTKIKEKIDSVPGLFDAINEVKKYSDENGMYYIISIVTDNTFKKYISVEITFFKEKPVDSIFVNSYFFKRAGADPTWYLSFYSNKMLMESLTIYSNASSNYAIDIEENKEIIKNFIDEKPSCGGASKPGFCEGSLSHQNYGIMDSNKTNNILEFMNRYNGSYSDFYLPLYANVDIKLQLKDDINPGPWEEGYNLPLFYQTEKDDVYYQLTVDSNFNPLFQKDDSDIIPNDTDDEVFILDSDKYAYFMWIIEEEKIYDDVWFEMDDIGIRSVGEIKYEYHIKGTEQTVSKIIKPENGKFVEKFPKELFSKIDHFYLEMYIPYQVDNTKYNIIWHNGAIMNEDGQIQDNIFNLADNSIIRGKYETVDLTNKYAVQLIFKNHVNPRFKYLEFHTLGEFNYYFKKQYGQTETVYDNSQVTDEVLDLTQVLFEDLEFIGGDELDSNISLFFVNNNFKKNNTVRTLLEYDSDMFDIVIFDNEWDDKEYVTDDGEHITLEPPSNILPDGSEDSNNLLGDINIKDILEHSFEALSSIFSVFSLMGGFVTALLTSLPPIFQTVLLWGFTTGILVIVLKILL